MGVGERIKGVERTRVRMVVRSLIMVGIVMVECSWVVGLNKLVVG